MTPEERLEKLRRLAELKGISIEAPKPQEMPSWLSDLMSYGPSFAKETGRSAVKGAGQALLGIPGLLGAGLEATGLPTELGPLLSKGAAKGNAALDRALPDRENLTDAEKRWDLTSKGVGGGAISAPLFGLGAAQVPAAGAAGAMGALGGEAGGNFAKKNDLPRLAGEIPGSLLAGGATGFMLGPKLSAVQDDLSRASRGLTKEQIAQALEKQKLFDKAGTQSNVLADTLPEGSPLRSLTDDVRNSEMGNPLSLRTQNRKADLTQLGEKFLNNLGPKVEPAKIATQLSDSANDFLTTSQSLRSDAIRNRMGAVPPPQQVEIFKLYRELASKARDPKVPGAIADPYREVAKQLLNQDGSPITNPQQLSLQIKQLKMRDANPLQQGGGASQIAPGNLKEAINFAEKRLGEIMPEYKSAMDEFRDFTRRGPQSTQTLGDLQNSPIRRMADANPSIEAPTPASKLNLLTSPENSAQTSQGIARLLSSPQMTGGRTVDPAAVLRGQGQMRLANDPTSIGNIVGGPIEENIAAVLSSMGRNVDDALAPARAARELQGSFRGAPNISEVQRMHPMQAAIRLLRTADMALTRAQQLKYAEEMGTILSQPGGEKVFAELQRLAQHDPSIRQKLSILSPMMGLGASQQ